MDHKHLACAILSKANGYYDSFFVRDGQGVTLAATTYREYSDGVGVYSFAGQGDHAHELVTAVYRASIWSLAALFSERAGQNART